MLKQTKQKPRPGDIFNVPLPNGKYATAKILLDVRNQCVKPKLIKPPSPLLSFATGMLVDLLSTVVDAPGYRPGNTIIRGVFVSPKLLESGDWPIIVNERVEPTQVEFPETLISHQDRANFRRGEVVLPVDLDWNELERIGAFSSVMPHVMFPGCCMFYLGMKDDIVSAKLPARPEAYSLSDADLRFNPHREMVYKLMGADPNQKYFELALTMGFDIRRFYQKV